MAFRFEKGKHIYFLFKNGHTVQDSQLKPRYYLDRHKAEIHLPRGDEIVEYAPVVHGWWERGENRNVLCGVCKKKALEVEEGVWYVPNFCPNCGADMRGGGEDG